MSKKNNRILLIVLVALLALYFGKRYLGNSGERNFKKELIALDTATVNKIVVDAKSNDRVPITLTRTGNDWEVSDGKITDNASPSVISGILASLASMKPERLITKSKGKWDANEVSDSLGTIVKVYNNDKQLADFVVGKFNYQQATRSMNTSVRLANSEDVYTVKGYLSSTYNRKTDDFRDKTFVNVNAKDLTKIAFTFPGDSSYVLEKTSNGWEIGGQKADSVNVNNYLSGLRIMNLREFANDFDPASHEHPYQMTIDGNNMSTVKVMGYATEDGLVLNSSLNDDAYFKQGSFKPFDRLFVSKTKFLGKK